MDKNEENNKNLKEKVETINSQLKEKSDSVLNKAKTSARKWGEEIQKVYTENSQKITKALSTLKNSNDQKIKQLASDIQSLPESIFRGLPEVKLQVK